MIRKKDVPLAILQALEKFVDIKGEKFEVLPSKEQVLRVIDKDTNSNFYFVIERYETKQDQTLRLLVNKRPASISSSDISRNWVSVSLLDVAFDEWLKLLNTYDNIPSFYDDPIVEKYANDYYTEFKFVDKEANKEPLSVNQTLLLDEYLECIQKKLQLPEYNNETNSEQIEEIQNDIKFLRENLTSKPKAWVGKKLSYVLAKISKQGTTFIKDFIVEFKKEGIKQGVRGLIEFIKENGNDLLSIQ